MQPEPEPEGDVTDDSTSATAALDEKLSPDLWVASCRPASGRDQLKSFAPRTALHQPPTDRFFCHCAKDPRACDIYARWQTREAQGGARAGNDADQLDDAHCKFYTHDLPDVDHGQTSVENHVALDLPIPFVRRAWVLPLLPVGSSDDGFVVPEVLQAGGGLHHRRVLIYVHGWKQRYRRTLQICDAMRERLGGRAAPARSAPPATLLAPGTADTEPDPDPPCVVMFTWPARGSHFNYTKARENAEPAGERLRQLIVELQDAGCRIAVYGHSLGCRVVLHALSAPNMVARPVEAALLAAAAVPANALATDGSFPLAKVAAKQMTVFYSPQDGVLGMKFKLAEANVTRKYEGKDALGLCGHVDEREPEPITRAGQGFSQVNMVDLDHRASVYAADERVGVAACEAVGFSDRLQRKTSLLTSGEAPAGEQGEDEDEDWGVESVSRPEWEPEPEPKATPEGIPPSQLVSEAVRSVCEVTGVTEAHATAALATCGADIHQAVDSLLQPHGWCLKQKPTAKVWQQRYIRLEGGSLNVYDSADHTEKRGSSIEDVRGCKLERGTGVPGVHKWFSGTKPQLVLRRADLQGGGEASFCFETDELCDRFVMALEVLGLVALAVDPTPL